MEKLYCSPENAKLFAEWIETRGGIATWKSANLSNLNQSWSTPFLKADGEKVTKPTWQAFDEASQVTTDINDVIVEIPKEVARVKIALERSGMKVNLTRASSKRLHDKLASIGDNCWYQFEDKETIIFVAEKQIPLADYLQGVR
jgi:hypothetical protein